jgi:phosphohistidine phosphatase
MAKRLLKKDIKIDAFVSSPALRAFTTCKYFAEAYDVKEKKIITVPELYDPTVSAFYHAIESLDDDYKHIAIFSHNPGITEFAKRLTTTSIDDMPTCAIFAVKAPIKQWKDFAMAEKEFWFFDYPKSQ